jgi:hypothetical protein
VECPRLEGMGDGNAFFSKTGQEIRVYEWVYE